MVDQGGGRKNTGSTYDSSYSQIITIHDRSKLEAKLEFLL